MTNTTTKHSNPTGCDHAYQNMLDYLLQFGMCIGTEPNARHGFGTPTFFSTQHDFQENDLVIATAMRDPEYRLSWLKEQIIHPSGDREFLLQSAKTGNQAWWSNIGLYVMKRDTSDNSQWRWTNEQWEFFWEWAKIQKEQDEYITQTYVVSFSDTHVLMGTRTRYSINNVKVNMSFLWRNASHADLLSMHEQLVKEHERAEAKEREQRDIKPAA